MQSRLQDSATEVRLGFLTSLSFHSDGDRNPYTRCAPEPQPTRSSNRVVGSLATPNRRELRGRARKLRPAPSRRSAAGSRCPRPRARGPAAGPDLISAGDRSCAIHQDAPPAFGAGSDTVQPAAGDAATRSRSGWRAQSLPARDLARPQPYVFTALAFWNAAVRHWHRPGRHIHQHKQSLRVTFGLHGERSGDRVTGTTIGSDVASERDSARLDGGEEIKSKST